MPGGRFLTSVVVWWLVFPPVTRKARVQFPAAEVWRAIFGAVWRFHCVVLLLLVGAHCVGLRARLAQSAKRNARNVVVVGSKPTVCVFAVRVSNMVVVGGWSKMDTLGIEPRAFRMQSGCDTTTPCARHRFRIGGLHVACWGPHPVVQHKRHRGDSNPCGQSPMDFESISLTARTHCHIDIVIKCEYPHIPTYL